MILDEPTAALDAREEARLFTELATQLRDASVLLVSHRFSTVKLADRIYVLDGGRVVEVGSHEELLDRHGLYRDLYDTQRLLLGA